MKKPDNSNSIRILIIDDELLDRRLTSRILLDLGYPEPLTAANAQEGLAMAKARHPHLVLMDINLAGAMNGIQAGSLIQADLATPIIFVTASLDPALIDYAQQAQPVGYLVKPLNKLSLHGTIRTGLERHRLERQLLERDALRRQAQEDLRVAMAGVKDAVKLRTHELHEANLLLQAEIAERTKFEEMLRDSEERLRLAVQWAPLPMMIHAEDGEVLLVNQVWSELTGYTHSDLPNMSRWVDLAYGPRAEAVRGTIKRLCRLDGRVDAGEFAVRAKDGRTLTWHFSGAPLGPGTDGRLLAISIAMDVTQRRLAESKLEVLNQRLRLLLDLASDGIHIHDLDGNLVDWSDSFRAMLGYDKEEMAGLNVSDWDARFNKEELAKSFQLQLQLQRPMFIETVHRRRDGNYLAVEINSRPIEMDGKQYIYASARDISERKKAEEKLRQSDLRFRLSFDNAPVGMAVVDDQRRFLDVNTKLCEMLGYEREELVGRPFDEFTHPDDLDGGKERWKALLKGEVTFNQAEKRYLHKDGRILWVLVSNTLVRNESGEPLYFTSHLVDISTRKKAEASAAELATIVASSMDAIIGMDLQGTITTWNAAAENIYGFSAEEAIGRHISMLMPEGHPDLSSQLWGTVLNGNVVKGYETVRLAKDGRLIDISLTISPLKDQDGNLVGISGISRDISERKLAELKLRQSDERYRALFDGINAGVAVYEVVGDGEDFIFKDFNRSGENIDGQSRQELVGRSILEARPQVEKFGLLEVMRRVWHTGRPEHHPLTFYEDNKLTGWFDNYVYRLPSGEIVAIFGDVTERKRAETALKENESLLRNIIDSSPDYIFVKDLDLRTFLCNRAFAAAVGKEPAELVGRTDMENGWSEEFVKGNPEKGIRGFEQDDLAALAGETVQISGELGNVGDEVRVFHTIKLPLRGPGGKVIGVLGVSRDVTAQKQAEKKLRESEELFREIYNNMSNGVAIYEVVDKGKDFIFKGLNQAGLRGGQKNLQGIMGRSVREVFPGVEDLGLFEVFKRVWESGQPEHYPSSIYHDGKITLWVENYVCKLPSGELVAIYEDNTARKLAEEALRASERKFKSFLEQSPVSIYLIKDEAFVYVNPKFAEMFGYSMQEYLDNMHFSQLVNPDDLASVNEQVRRRVEGETDSVRYEFKGIKKDGQILYGEVHGSTIDYEGGFALMGTILDISDRKKAEEERSFLEAQLAKAQKMDALGTLASGIAHDFNNLLAAILGYSELIQDELPEDAGIRQDMAEIIKAADKAKTLIRRILTFSRESQAIRKPIDIDDVFRDTTGILSRIIPKMISLEFELDQDLWRIKADPQQIEQILLNLASNATDAIGERGTITIAARNMVVENKPCEVCGKAFTGKYVLVSVRDTGSGMSPKTRARIFEPFFTTKGVGRGTGLGLATVYGIVTSHEGHISCLSEEGKGTEFQVYLPAAKNEIVQTDLNGLGQDAPLQGNETILVVDDEAVVRDIAQRILTRNGYQVLQAPSGEEALAVYREHLGRIDGVIMDLGMPGMGGKACLPLILDLDPEAKVLIASGYIQYELTDELKKLGAAGMIAKPFRNTDLLKNVRKVLNGKVAD